MKKIALVGSTGSIGRQVIEVVSRCPGRFCIVAMAANSSEQLFAKQAAARCCRGRVNEQVQHRMKLQQILRLVSNLG